MKKKLAIIFLITATLLFIGMFVVYKNVKNTTQLENLKPYSDGVNDVVFVVNAGESVNDIINNLEKEKLIKSSKATYKYAIDNDINTINQGSYLLKPSMSSQEILKILSSTEAQTIKITLIEGRWIKDYAKVIATATNLKEEDILAYWTNVENVKKFIPQYSFLSEDILKPEIRYAFEGYIFPDTYLIPYPKDMNVNNFMETLTHQIFKNFQNKWDELQPYNHSKLTYHEIVTLASIVEFEGNDEYSRNNIAGVFYNRLKARMPLQSCATVDYAMNEHKLQYTFEDLKFESPYNTYNVSALPIGPVSNPSFQSLKATVFPTEHTYYYFLSDVKGDSKTYFSTTLEEHEQKKEKYGLND